MNQRQFIKELQQLKGWYKTPSGAIRRRRPGTTREECPVTAVCNHLYSRIYDIGQFVEAGELLTLSKDLADDIATASDTRASAFKSTVDSTYFAIVKMISLRQRLEEACNVAERQ